MPYDIQRREFSRLKTAIFPLFSPNSILYICFRKELESITANLFKHQFFSYESIK